MEIGDFVCRKAEPDKVYRISCFSNFKGGYLDGTLVVTLREKDGCSWSMTMATFNQAGYVQVHLERSERDKWL